MVVHGVDICMLDSGPIVRAAASCALKNLDQCEDADSCNWACYSATNPTRCCQPSENTTALILQRQSLNTACGGETGRESCTAEATSSACVWKDYSDDFQNMSRAMCAVNEGGRLLQPQEILWSFVTVDSENLTLIGGPLPQDFIDDYNREYAAGGVVSEHLFTQRMTSSSAQHLRASLACAVHDSRSACSAQCTWAPVVYPNGTSAQHNRCILSPEGAVRSCETFTEPCSDGTTGPLQYGGYSVFVLLLMAAIATDITRNGVAARNELIGILMENIVAIGGLSLFIYLYTLAFLRVSCVDFMNIVGLVITMIGLTVFSRGLSTGLMPLAENVGRELPGMIPLLPMLLVIFCLGVLCTIAEPSIQALQAAGETVDFSQAPFVKIVLSPDYVPAPGEAAQNWVLVLKIMVGFGVGIASVIGTLRLVLSHGIKKYAGGTFLPAIFPTVIACLFFATAPEHLQRSTGLAWDCGAVTTGPVTVPIVLAIGIGMAAAAKSTAIDDDEDNPVEISLPAVAVYANSGIGLGGSLVISKNMERREKSFLTGSIMTASLAASRSNLGSMAEDLPQARGSQPAGASLGSNQVRTFPQESFEISSPELHTTTEEGEEPNLDGFGIVTFASLLPCMTVWILTFTTMVMFKDDVVAAALDDPFCPRLTDLPGLTGSSGEFANIIQPDPSPFWCLFVDAVTASCQAVFPLVGFLFLVQFLLVRRVPPGFPGIVCGCVVTLMGMVCFNIGLTTSLQPIGNKVGQLMPSAQVYYGTLGGDLVMLLFGFLAGVGATFSEPALSALGDTVDALTKGKFKKSALIGAVAIGVGVGIIIGLAKIRWELPLWIILSCGYSVAFALTAVSEEAITCVAWDSAGVTTGPVTVPIVLAVGGSIASANQVAEGFGILACASFGPIIAVLIVGRIQAMNAKR